VHNRNSNNFLRLFAQARVTDDTKSTFNDSHGTRTATFKPKRAWSAAIQRTNFRM